MEEGRRSPYACPRGADGAEAMRLMNEHHKDLTEWAFDSLADISPDTILDVGCGGGGGMAAANRRWPDARLTGVDISSDALEFCSETMLCMGMSGVRLVEASAERLPFEDGFFDMVMTVESYFFWDDLEKGLAEMMRVAREGGSILVCAEAYPHPDFQERNDNNARIHGMRLRTPEELVSMLSQHGSSAIAKVEEKKNWVAVISIKG